MSGCARRGRPAAIESLEARRLLSVVGPIDRGQIKSSALASGQTDIYTYAGAVNDLIELDMANCVSGSFSAVADLIATNGTTGIHPHG